MKRSHRAASDAGRAFYSSRRWRAVRARYLAGNPFCVMCESIGLRTRAEHLDHIVRITDGGAPWDESNFQPLCLSHHSSKTRADVSGVAMRIEAPRPPRIKGADVDGLPIDPCHWWRKK